MPYLSVHLTFGITPQVMPALHDAGDIPRANAGLLRMVKLFLSVGGSATISDEVLKWKNLRSAVKTTPATSVSA